MLCIFKLKLSENLVVLLVFSSENKDTYIKVFQDGENFGVEHERGINIKNWMGCIILCRVKPDML